METHVIVCLNNRMKPLFVLLLFSCALVAQGPMQPNVRYQPTFDEVKSALNLNDDQFAKLKQLQQDKMAATQAFYTKMSDKQKELNALLENNSQDAAKIGQLMLELQQLRKQPPPGAGDLHEKAVEVLTADQKMKLHQLEEAQKMRGAVDQAVQLGLLVPPANVSNARPTGPGVMHPMGAVKTPPSAKQ